MRFFDIRWWVLIALFVVGCSSSEEEMPKPESTPLSTPVPTITVAGQEATARWSAIEGVLQYHWELQKSDQSVESGSCRTTSYSFEMAQGESYRFRVKAQARENSGYSDSAWSDYVAVSSNMLSTPQPELRSVTATEAAFAWAEVPNAGSYRYEVKRAGGSEVLQNGTIDVAALEISELESGLSYTLQVMALTASERYSDSSWSAPLEFTTRTIEQLEAPVLRITALGFEEVSVDWPAVSGAARYALTCYPEEGEEPCWSGETTSLTMQITGLTEKSSYRLTARALTDGSDPYLADSDPSEPLLFTTRSSQGADVGLPLAHENDGVIRAFPGAEGGGMYTTGGRGGKILKVTSLADDGSEGTLRWAVNQKGARTIVFEVCGTIQLQSQLSIKHGDLTIAGQTAPGDGICLRDYTVYVGADNVIIRYMRFRMGDETNQENDAIWGRYQQDIILDHCSMSWSTDECSSFYANCNFTMQWCLVGESLCNSVHGKGAHGYGGIWGGRNASFHHNLLTAHKSRNPRFDHPNIYEDIATQRGHVDYRNNVIYNWGDNSTYGGEGGWFNMVGNYYKPGPASKKRNYFIDANSYYSSGKTQYDYPRLYLEDNFHEGDYASGLYLDQWSGVKWHDGTDVGDYAGAKCSAPMAIKREDTQGCYTTTHEVMDAYERVLGYVGASLRRDAVDSRLVGDAREGKATYTSGGNGSSGGIIDTQSAVGGWPTLSATEQEVQQAATDSDGDGIPDYYEEQLGLNAYDAEDAAKISLDPAGLYSNFEVYLHFLVLSTTKSQCSGGVYTALD